MPVVSEGSLWRYQGPRRHEGQVCPGCRAACVRQGHMECTPYHIAGWLCLEGDERGEFWCETHFNHMEGET